MQGTQVAPTGAGHADAAVQPLQIGNVFQLCSQLFASIGRFQQFFHGIQPLPDRLDPDQRIAEPLFQPSGPHGSACAVQATEQRTVPLPLSHAGGNLQIAAGGRIKGKMFVALLYSDITNMRQSGLAVLAQVIQGSGGGQQRLRKMFQSKRLRRCGLEMAA